MSFDARRVLDQDNDRRARPGMAQAGVPLLLPAPGLPAARRAFAQHIGPGMLVL